jgi:hypothetical protein
LNAFTDDELHCLRSNNKGACKTTLLLALNLNATERGGEGLHSNWGGAIWGTYLAEHELWKLSNTLNKYPLVDFNDS